MTNVKKFLTLRWVDRVSDAAGYTSAIALVVATLVVLHGVLTRYLLSSPTIWQTEFATYLLIAVAFVGAAYGLKSHAHVGVDLLLERLTKKKQVLVRTVTAVLALGVVAVVGWTSMHTWWDAYQGGYRSGTGWGAPLVLVYAILPTGMLLVGLQYLRFIIDAILCLLRDSPGKALILGSADPFIDAPGQGPTEDTTVRPD